MLKPEIFTPELEQYIINLRRELHQCPEVGFELEKTTAIVKRELEANGIAYTEKYCESSVVADINPECTDYTLAIRADMDALPVEENTGLEFSSKHEGRMHACGHDAHTAILLGTAKALKSIESELNCRVRLIFQPCEEGSDGGGKKMTANGAVDDVDAIVALHVEPLLPTGHIGIYPGASMAARRFHTIEFFGKSSHAAFPQNGNDALAMAVKAYNDIQIMFSRLNPMSNKICAINYLHAGVAENVIPDYAKMLISVRSFDLEEDEFIHNKICEFCDNAAKEIGGSAKVVDNYEAYPVVNDRAVRDNMIAAIKSALGEEYFMDMPQKMSSEDFSFFLQKTRGCMMCLGIKNEEKGCTGQLHNSDIVLDEDAFINGCKVFTEFVLLSMNGIPESDK